MSSPKVSVVICTYNQVSYIRDTVESVLAQTYQNIEIIVADDASTDGARDVLRELEESNPDRLIVIYGDTNLGIPSNINRGLSRVSGQYVAWLDGDDLMLPQKIQLQVELLENSPEACGCYHDATVFDSASGREYGSFAQLYNGTKRLRQGSIHDTLVPRYFALPSTTMCRAEFVPKHGFDVRLSEFSEFLFFTDVFVNGKVLTLDQELTRYRRHDANLTANDDFRRRSLENELVAYAIITARYPQLAGRMNRFRTSSLLTQALYCARKGNPRDARQYLAAAGAGGAPFRSFLVAGVAFGLWVLGKLTVGKSDALASAAPYRRNAIVQQLIGILLG